jgi:hypothetical protein
VILPPWLATWGPLLVACIVGAVVMWLGRQVVRLSRRVDELSACRQPVHTTFGKYMGRCERRDEHPPDLCTPGEGLS